MKKTGLLSIAILTVTIGTAQNSCITAIPVGVGSYVVSAVDGPEIPDPICAQNGLGNTSASEWYSFTATGINTITVSTDLPGTQGVDTRVHIYSGQCGSLTCVGGDDDSGVGNNTSIASWNSMTGTRYLIAFDNRWSSAGFHFKITESEPVNSMINFTAQSIGISGSALAVVDMDGDGLDDLVAVTSTNINIHHQQATGGFSSTNITTTTADHAASWSLAAGDLDDNGFRDLMYGSGSGVTFMIANEDGTVFHEVSPPEYIFTQRTNFIDINNDGFLDAFACHDVEPNCYFMNDGNGVLTFYQGGIGDTPSGGNYGSLWVDYDNDGDADCFISKCRGAQQPSGINQLLQNNGGVFTDVAPQLGLADNTQTWSSAWGDFDNDGDMDVMVGASSFQNGGHQLMRNDGFTTFTNVTAGSGYDTFTGVGHEHVTYDFNNDGWLDIMGAGNTIMINNGNMTFTPSPVPASIGPMGDLNNDGFWDIVNEGTIYMNSGNNNNYLKVRTIGTVSNRDGIGARVEVMTAQGNQIRDVRAGEGFRYMSSIGAHFGLGLTDAITEVIVRWPSGIVDHIMTPTINGTLTVVEGAHPVGIDEAEAAELNLFPNPVQDILQVTAATDLTNAIVSVLDASGKLVVNATLINGRVDVSKLTGGAYTITITKGKTVMVRKFTKH